MPSIFECKAKLQFRVINTHVRKYHLTLNMNFSNYNPVVLFRYLSDYSVIRNLNRTTLMIKTPNLFINSGFILQFSTKSTSPFVFQNVLEQPNKSSIEFKKLHDLSDGIQNVQYGNSNFLNVDPKILRELTREAIIDVSHFLRPSHLKQLSNILKDSEASKNDRTVAIELLKNANIASAKILPGCQDTGTAIVIGHKGQNLLTDGDDEKHISHGIHDAYVNTYLRYSQLAPKSMFVEENTRCNLPAQVEIYSKFGMEYELLFLTKGGGSANKTFLFQETKAILNPDRLKEFILERVKKIGTSACPPYHLAIVIGGLSAEYTLKVVKLASCRYLDGLNTSGNSHGRAFRDLEWEDNILQLTREIGIGAQFGGKYFCHDVRVIRLPRHGASCPVGIGVSCSADRQILGKITSDGVYLEKLEYDPAKYLPAVEETDLLGSSKVEVDLCRPMKDILNQLSQYPVTTQLSLSGTLIVARDIAHSKIIERYNNDGYIPQYLKDHPIYYAGPAKTPEGYICGSFGPTTAGRMDPYIPTLMKCGSSLITLAKGNRSKQVSKACKEYGGFYLGSIGGPAAALAKNCIKKSEVLEYPELGMEAIYKIEVENFPAFIVIDDKGNDFYSKFLH